MVTHDLSEAFRLATRVIAFERARDLPEEQERYGATLSGDLQPVQGATITRDIEIYPRRVPGSLIDAVSAPAA
jgi:NitT/TauT family transport system ATP-binding protein